MKRYLFAILLLVAAPAQAELYPTQWTVPCTGDVNEILDIIAGEYNERRSAASVTPNASFELWLNKETESWSLLFRRPDGVACVVVTGDGEWIEDKGF